MKEAKLVVLSLLTGVIVGFIFEKLSLPVPAPPTIDAFMGIFGVWLGSVVIDKISK